jgi:hypothetical protein
VAITDLDEWLRPDVAQDRVTLDVDDTTIGLALRASLVVTPADRHVRLTVSTARGRAVHEADEAGPPPSNWDRMRIGAVDWRMVEPLRQWELAVDDVEAGLRGYLAFLASGLCVPLADGYEQVGTVSGQLHLAGGLIAITGSPARRTHTWL